MYKKAAQLLGLQPEEVMMVAAHNSDLVAARAVGFKTAFVYRTKEYGSIVKLLRFDLHICVLCNIIYYKKWSLYVNISNIPCIIIH